MRTYSIIVFTLILGVHTSIAQVGVPDLSISYKDVDGSPYLCDKFKYGDVYYGGNDKLEQIPLRLNLYKDQLEYKKAEKVMVFANPERFDSVVIGEEVYMYLEKRRNYQVTGFVKMLNSNTPALFSKMKIAFINRKRSTSHYEQSNAGRFEREEDKYYIKNSDDEVKRVTNVKMLIREFEKHRAELTKYSKSEEISINNPEDLVKLVDYYHELEN